MPCAGEPRRAGRIARDRRRSGTRPSRRPGTRSARRSRGPGDGYEPAQGARADRTWRGCAGGPHAGVPEAAGRMRSVLQLLYRADLARNLAQRGAAAYLRRDRRARRRGLSRSDPDRGSSRRLWPRPRSAGEPRSAARDGRRTLADRPGADKLARPGGTERSNPGNHGREREVLPASASAAPGWHRRDVDADAPALRYRAFQEPDRTRARVDAVGGCWYGPYRGLSRR